MHLLSSALPVEPGSSHGERGPWASLTEVKPGRGTKHPPPAGPQDEFRPRLVEALAGRIIVPPDAKVAAGQTSSFCTIVGGQLFAWGKLKPSGGFRGPCSLCPCRVGSATEALCGMCFPRNQLSAYFCNMARDS